MPKSTPTTPMPANTSPRRTLRAATKKARVLSLAKRARGVTVMEIVSKLEVSTPAARALVGDLRRDGVKFSTVRGKTARYRVSA